MVSSIILEKKKKLKLQSKIMYFDNFVSVSLRSLKRVNVPTLTNTFVRSQSTICIVYSKGIVWPLYVSENYMHMVNIQGSTMKARFIFLLELIIILYYKNQ